MPIVTHFNILTDIIVIFFLVWFSDSSYDYAQTNDKGWYLERQHQSHGSEDDHFEGKKDEEEDDREKQVDIEEDNELVYLEIDKSREEDDEEQSWRTTMAKRRSTRSQRSQCTSVELHALANAIKRSI
jgi:hypothetical protein